jgi:hypothetical protein
MCEIALDGPSRSQSKRFELILWLARATHASVFVFAAVHVRLLAVLWTVDCGVRYLTPVTHIRKREQDFAQMRMTKLCESLVQTLEHEKRVENMGRGA